MVCVLLGSAARLVSVNGVAPFRDPSPMAVPWLMVTMVGDTPAPRVVNRVCGITAASDDVAESSAVVESPAVVASDGTEASAAPPFNPLHT